MKEAAKGRNIMAGGMTTDSLGKPLRFHKAGNRKAIKIEPIVECTDPAVDTSSQHVQRRLRIDKLMNIQN